MPFPLTFVDGKVGIGVSNPDAELDVNGDVDISGTLTVAGAAVYGAIVVTSITTSTGVVTSTVANSGTNTAHTLDTSVAMSGTTNLLKLSNHGTQKVTVDYNGSINATEAILLGQVAASRMIAAPPYTSPVQLLGLVPNGASAVAVVIDNIPALSTTGAKLLSVQNNSVEKLSVDKDGTVFAESFAAAKSGLHVFGYSSDTTIINAPNGGGVRMQDANNGTHWATASAAGVEVDVVGQSFILKSADGTRWKLSVANTTGVLTAVLA